MGTIFYFFNETVRGMFAAKLMTFVSIITIGASLFFMTIIGLGIYTINGLLKQTGNQSDMAVYLKDDFSADKNNVEAIMASMRGYQQVKRVAFVTKDSAMSKFASVYGSDMLDAVTGNPLPASIDIYIVDKYRTVNDIKGLQEKFQILTGVESVRYSREWIDLVERFRGYFMIGAVVLITVMLLVLHIMISNTIKLTIYARQELVKNMQLVGATRFFINTPFILEGMLQGVLGGCVSVVALTIMRIAFNHIPVLWGPDLLPVFILLTGAFFGWFGSVGAVRKFMV